MNQLSERIHPFRHARSRSLVSGRARVALIRERLNQVPIEVEAAENLRIEQGIPRWGNELSESVLPNEAGLDKRAISYTKGCYLGQEVMSRIKSLGHVNRQLRGLLPSGGLLLESGDQLVGTDEAGKEIGFITSVGRGRALDHAIALGYVKRGFDAPGFNLASSPEQYFDWVNRGVQPPI